MEYVQFGRSGLWVSRLALGSWRMHRTPEDQIIPLIHEALDAGVNLIDTARDYAGGQAALGKLVELAKAHSHTPTQLALAFVMKHPVTAIPIIGPRTSAQLHDCLGACDVAVDETMSNAFDAICPPGDRLMGQPFNAYNHGPTARWF